MKNFLWLVKREFWENRAIWIAPLAIGAVLNLAVLFGRIDLVTMSNTHDERMPGGVVLALFGATFFVVMVIYSTWYLLDCLYTDRKDRSILFWKSLPLSDAELVLSKLFTALIAIPLVYFLVADVSTLFMAFIISIRAHALFGNTLWRADVWLQLQALWLYLIVTTAIWYLPFTGWLMLMSAWAKRAVMLWAILPLLTLNLLERWFIGSNHFGQLLGARVVGYVSTAFREGPATAIAAGPANADSGFTTQSVWQILDPGSFVSSAATWIGLAAGIALIFGAIQLRSRRSDI